MIVSSLYSPDGNVDTLSVSLLIIMRWDGLLTFYDRRFCSCNVS